MAKLTYKQKKALPKSAFAIKKPAKGKATAAKGQYPIHDIAHARNALARVSAFGTSSEKAQVRRAVYAKYPSLKPKKKAARKAGGRKRK